MLLGPTCASAICFAPELDLYSLSGTERAEIRQAAPPKASHFINVQYIVISSRGMPTRYLTEREQSALDRALYKSIRIVGRGRQTRT